VRLVEPASIEISDLRSYDEGWYECSVVTLDEQTGEETTNNGSWVHLTVNGQNFSVSALCFNSSENDDDNNNDDAWLRNFLAVVAVSLDQWKVVEELRHNPCLNSTNPASKVLTRHAVYLSFLKIERPFP